MVGSVVKGKASASKSKGEALTLISADSEPVKSSAEEANAASLVGEGENNEIHDKDEKSMDGQKTDENVCGRVIVNANEEREQVVDEGHDEDRDAVNEIKVNEVDYVPISEKTQVYPEEVNKGDGVANMEEMTTQEVLVKDNETVIYELDVKDVDIGEERKNLEAVAENTVHGGGVAYAKKVDGGSVANANEKTIQEVPVKDNVTVICGLNIKDVDTREETKSSEVVSNSMVDGGGLTNPEDVNGGGCLANTEETTPPELLINKNGAVICGLEITDVNCSRAESNSLDMFKDDMTDGSLAVSLHQRTDKILIDNLQNEKEADKLNAEVPLGVILDNGNRECRMEGASSAPNVKSTPETSKIRKRKPLNRKAFQNMVPGNNEASMNEAKALSSIGNDACNRVNEADSNEHLKQDDKAEAKPLVCFGKKLKRVRKEVLKGRDGIIASNDESESELMNELQNKANKKTDDQDLNNEEAEKSGDRISLLQRSNDRKLEKEHTIEVAGERSKSSKEVSFLGMIFMCSSETKEDCYRYRVLGLPAGKKDMVLKIYKGMRLFLFDVNRKMMYGIYKATGPGGYNIEPRAFRSQFPSQVSLDRSELDILLFSFFFRSNVKHFLEEGSVEEKSKIFHQKHKPDLVATNQMWA